MQFTPNRQLAKYAIVGAFFVLHLFFIQTYLTDKTVVPAQISESMLKSGLPYAQNISCIDGEEVKNMTTWAEEPPLFHALAILMIKLGMNEIFFRLLPLICIILYALGMAKLTGLLIPYNSKEKNLVLIAALLCPFAFIHATRFLPDNLALAALVWFLVFFFRRKYTYSTLLAYIAVTGKALAIFPIAAVVAGHLFFCQRETIKKKLTISLITATSLLPMIAWLYYLQSNNISNPFFLEELSLSRHTGGSDFGILITRKYWSKVFSWVVVRGMSIPLYALSIYALVSILKNNKKSYTEKIILGYVVGHFVYLIVVRGQQTVSPWYSFYFMPCYFILAMMGLKQITAKKWKAAVVALAGLTSISLVDWRTTDTFDFYPRKVKNSPALPCDQHSKY